MDRPTANTATGRLFFHAIITIFDFVNILPFGNEGVQKVFGTLDLFVSLLETEIKYPILQGGILPFWTPSLHLLICIFA